MNALPKIALSSAWNRRFVLALVLLSIALSTFLLLGLERLRADMRDHFSQSVSGTDLIVGARTSPIQLLLYSVFRIGNATNNIQYRSVEKLAQHKTVAWAIPISLGDSHRGFTVVGTSTDYFTHFRYGEQQPLVFGNGRAFSKTLEAVIGVDVAQRLGYALGDHLVLSHGDGKLAINDHTDHPFTVVGILQRTGTPVDRSIHVDLESIDAIHTGWMSAPQGKRQVTALLLGLKSRAAVFSVQRAIADFEDEPLMAILPGVALDELWEVIGIGENSLRFMGALVSLVSFLGLIAVISAGLEQRRRELAILRTLGARPRDILFLLALEGAFLTLSGLIMGAAACLLAMAALSGWAASSWGIAWQARWPNQNEWALLGAIFVCGSVASLLPAWRAYRLSLSDGLSPKV